LWGQLAKAATRPVDEQPEPRPKDKEKTDKGMFRPTAAALIRRIARVVKLAPRAFANAAAAATMRVADILPDEYSQAQAYEALDAANPYWDFSFDSDAAFEFDSSGPSLDL
jgi:hypothetical protein